MLSKYLLPLLPLLLATGAAAQDLLAPVTLPIGGNSILCARDPTLSVAPNPVEPGATATLSITGQPGCFYAVDTPSGGSATYLIPGILSSIITPYTGTIPFVPTVGGASAITANLVGSADLISAPYNVLCAAPNFVLGTNTLAPTVVPVYSSDVNNLISVTISGTPGCTYDAQVGTGPIQTLTIPTTATGPVTLPLSAGTTPSAAGLPLTITDPAAPTVPLLSALVLSGAGCESPSIEAASDDTQVLQGTPAFPLYVSGSVGCSYVLSIPGFGTQVIGPLVSDAVPLSAQAPTAAGTYQLEIGTDSTNLVAGTPPSVLQVVAACANPVLDSTAYTVTSANTIVSPQLTSGTYGCTYDATVSFAPNVGADLSFNSGPLVPSILTPLPLTAGSFNLQTVGGTGTVSVTGGTSPVTATIGFNQDCTQAPAVSIVPDSSPVSTTGNTLTLPYTLTGIVGCAYTVTDPVTGVSTSIPDLTAITTSGTVQVPTDPGTYTLSAESSGGGIGSATFTATAVCTTTPSFSAADIFTGLNQGFGGFVNGALGCPYDIYLDGNRIVSGLQLANSATQAAFTSADAFAAPGSHTLQVVNAGANINTLPATAIGTANLVVQPTCDAPPTFGLGSIDLTGTVNTGVDVNIVGQAGCTYELEVSNAANTFTFAFTLPDTATSATFDPIIPATGTFTTTLSLPNTNLAVALGSLVIAAPACNVQWNFQNPILVNPPTFSAIISNAAECNAQNVYFTFTNPLIQYPATVTGDIYSYTFTEKISTLPGTVTIHAGAVPSIDAYTFAASAATGALVPRRRALKCEFGQDRCPVRSKGGKIGWEDLYTNLERCGSCGGPDCSQIANANEVACIDGLCVVSSCVMGFESTGSACIKI